MSDSYYKNKFSKALLDTLNQIHLEQLPSEIVSGTSTVSSLWSKKDMFNYIFNMYIRYIEISKRVEDCYDQILYPQMRKIIKKFLYNILCRIVQLKKELLYINYTSLSPVYLYLDNYLVEFKLEPDSVNLVLPRLFREDDNNSFKVRRKLYESRLKKYLDIDSEEYFPKKNFFKKEISIDDAIKIIQTFELGRQNLKRINHLIISNKKVENEFNMTEDKKFMDDERKKIAIEQLIASKKIKKMREDEFVFLKMLPDNTPQNIVLNNFSEENKKLRKINQNQKALEYDKYKNNLIEKIKTVESYDIKEAMKNDRRAWINKEKALNNGKPPQSLDEYYKRNAVDNDKLNELDENQKKEQEKIDKDKLKKEQDKKKKDEQGAVTKVDLYAGGSEQVKDLTNNIEEFKSIFETPNEFIIKKDGIIANIAREEIIGNIEKMIKEEVDVIIETELMNMKTNFLGGKKDKPMKKVIIRPPPEKFGPGEKAIAKIDVNDLFTELVEQGIIKLTPKRELDDLICDFNYCAENDQVMNNTSIEVPLFYTKQLIKELCIYPLGSQLVKSSGKLPTASVLFGGPSGTGKTHAALSIAYHTDALFFDLSPANLAKYATKQEVTTIVAKSFRVAKNFQPAILYFEYVEQIIPDTKVKGGVKNALASRLKKLFISYKNLINENMRILFIGTTNRGSFANTKDLKILFDKTLYFSLPSKSDCYKLWKNEIHKRIGRHYDLEYDVLSHMSRGYSQESIIACIEYTLTSSRLERLTFKTLETQEFIASLSKTPLVNKQDYDNYLSFIDKTNGLKEVIEAFEKANSGEGKKK